MSDVGVAVLRVGEFGDGGEERPGEVLSPRFGTSPVTDILLFNNKEQKQHSDSQSWFSRLQNRNESRKSPLIFVKMIPEVLNSAETSNHQGCKMSQ